MKARQTPFRAMNRNGSGTRRDGPGVLGEDDVLRRLYARDPQRRLVVSPLIEPQIEGGTVDLRLGTKFILLQRSATGAIDPIEVTAEGAKRIQTREEVAFGQPYVLHPGHLILASSFEYVGLPSDICAYVITRSSYGRIGLLTATAVFVHPGFKGCLTLELYNYGDAPISLFPGIRVAQLALHWCRPSRQPRNAKYRLCTEPQFPRLETDGDRVVLRALRQMVSGDAHECTASKPD